ncbi:MAG: glycosyltransferase family A protein [Patescibacteria group bacterium]
MSSPKISVIIPAYNCAKTIGRCLNGLFAQTLQDFEVIVVNDGSKDDLDGAISPWLARIKYIKQANSGAPTARNNGFKESVGEYVIFFDADIVAKPSLLAKLLKALEGNSDASYAYSSFIFGWKRFKLWPFDAGKLRQMPYIHTSALIRREHFPGFDPSLKKFQDWDLWLTMLEQGHQGVWVNEVLFRAISGGTMSSWLPSIFYRLPIRSKNKDKYFAARDIIKAKHNLP